MLITLPVVYLVIVMWPKGGKFHLVSSSLTTVQFRLFQDMHPSDDEKHFSKTSYCCDDLPGKTVNDQ